LTAGSTWQQEPRRLWRRDFTVSLRFLVRALLQLMKATHGSGSKRQEPVLLKSQLPLLAWQPASGRGSS
jgi:hypothetical protein